MSEKVFVLLPVHNRRDITEKFIFSLLGQTYDNYHLILIDDGSTDGTAGIVRSKVSSEKLTVIRGKGDWWWAGSLQQGISWLRKHPIEPSDIVLIINDDVTFDSDFLENGVVFLRHNPQSMLLARFYDENSDEVMETGVKIDFRNFTFRTASSPEEINCLSTRGLFLTWSVLRRMGGFHPFILPHYLSDYEFTMRAAKLGVGMKTVPHVYLRPDLSATGIREGEGETFLYEIRRMFSKRCVYNPIYETLFILLAFPTRFVFHNIARVWISAAWRLVKVLFR